MESTDAIVIEGLTKKFGNVQALKKVSLGIKKGELFFLLGGSGCGKTTLLRCIAGLETPTDGSIYFTGEDVTNLPAHKRKTAMVFQSYALWPHLKVGQNVAFGLEERKVPKDEIQKRVTRALEIVHLQGYEGRRIEHMSGGQQQRVALARALVVRPKCLLLDEPLSNLDAKLRLEMRGEIRRIVKENNLTAVYVTHDQEEALSIADRMAVLHEGELCQVGTPSEIYRQPNSRHVASFIGEANELEGKILSLDGGFVNVETSHGVFRGISHKALKEGRKVWVTIRPEAFRRQNSAENSISGKILNRVYLGASIQYQVQIENGAIFNVKEMNPQEILEPGDQTIAFQAKAEDVMILSE